MHVGRFPSPVFGLSCILAFSPPGNGDVPRNVGRWWYRGWNCASRRIRFLFPPQTNCLKFLNENFEIWTQFKKIEANYSMVYRVHSFLSFSHLSFPGKSLQKAKWCVALLVWNRALIWTWSKLCSFKILHWICILFLFFRFFFFSFYFSITVNCGFLGILFSFTCTMQWLDVYITKWWPQ